MPHTPEHVKFRPSAVESSFGELRRNFPGVARAAGAVSEFFDRPTTRTSAFPAGALSEVRRTRELLNPDFRGVVANALPQVAQAARDVGTGLAGLPAAVAEGVTAPQTTDAAPIPPTATPVVPDIQPDSVGPDLLTARGFSPGVTEIVGGTGSRLFTNLLSPTATPEAATGFARRAATEGIRLPGQLSTTARPLEGDQFAINRLINAPEGGVTPVAGSRQPNGFGAARVTTPAPVVTPAAPTPAAPTTGFGRRLEAPAGAISRTGETGFDVRPTVERGDRRLTGGAADAFADLGEARRVRGEETQFVTTEDVLRRTGDTGTGSGLVRRNARQIAQEENAAFAQAENIATRDIGLGLAERRVAATERQAETQASLASTQAKAQAAKEVKDATDAEKDLTSEDFEFEVVAPGVLDQFGGQKLSRIKLGNTEFTLDNAGAAQIDQIASDRTAAFFEQNPNSKKTFEQVRKAVIREALRANSRLLIPAAASTEEG